VFGRHGLHGRDEARREGREIRRYPFVRFLHLSVAEGRNISPLRTSQFGGATVGSLCSLALKSGALRRMQSAELMRSALLRPLQKRSLEVEYYRTGPYSALP
jgi:hypothetical protein